MGQPIIYVKMTKEWAGFQIGEIVRFGESKGRSRIELGMGIEVPKPKSVVAAEAKEAKAAAEEKAKAEADAKAATEAATAANKSPEVENATNVPAGETAEVSPKTKQKTDSGNKEKTGKYR